MANYKHQAEEVSNGLAKAKAAAKSCALGGENAAKNARQAKLAKLTK